jgi:hypothetical protein
VLQGQAHRAVQSALRTRREVRSQQKSLHASPPQNTCHTGEQEPGYGVIATLSTPSRWLANRS